MRRRVSKIRALKIRALKIRALKIRSLKLRALKTRDLHLRDYIFRALKLSLRRPAETNRHMESKIENELKLKMKNGVQGENMKE